MTQTQNSPGQGIGGEGRTAAQPTSAAPKAGAATAAAASPAPAPDAAASTQTAPAPSASFATPRAAHAFISARNLGLKSLNGFAYEDANLDIARGELAAICGDHGCGKTSLLLTIAGRMHPTHGTLRVKNFTTPKGRKDIAKISDLGIFEGLNEPDKNIRVGTIMCADLDLGGKPHKKADGAAYLEKWGLSHVADLKVRQLTQPQRVLFGVALASCSSPEIIVVDDLEDQLTINQSIEILEALKRFAHKTNTTVVVGITEESLTEYADSVHFIGRH